MGITPSKYSHANNIQHTKYHKSKRTHYNLHLCEPIQRQSLVLMAHINNYKKWQAYE